ncbi:restriction endonuclease subunit S [Campylobacter volucris]|uniref:restriction endonuclease subunit S n=2 Tax=Campylobacter volucris TaxID=1031542 RepID=UPI0018A0DE89|nr:restriction endonuclease subunit S [Campylobacter volucris]MBF7048450.1 restriction endonuclease subunit S [Campylobacter volucris]
MTNLPQGWEVKKLGDIAEIQIGKTPSRNNIDFFQGENIWLSIRDLKSKFVSFSSEKISNEAISKTNMKIVPKGTLLMSFKLTLGKTAFTDCDLYTNEAIAAIFIKDKNINKYFLDYALNFTDLEKYVDNAVKGKTLNKQKLKQIKIPLPPLKEQKRIVGILDESFANIDESIKILEQDLLNLDELMQSALQKAFNPLKDTTKENYQLPQGWEWKSLGDIAVTSSGGTPLRNKKEYWENGTIKWLKSGELNDGYIDFIEENITQEAIKHSSAKIFSKGTLLIAMYGATAGKLGILDLDSATNQAICAFLHKDNENINFFEKFLFHFLFFIRDKIIKDSFGGAQPNISQTYIKNLQIPIPPLQEQEQIASYLDELSLNIKDLKQNYQAQIKNLQELKKSLLDKAFKGRL